LGIVTAFPGNENSQQPLMPSLTQTAFLLSAFSGTTK